MASLQTVCVLTDSLKFFEYMVTGCSKFKNVILKVVDPNCPGILATYSTCILLYAHRLFSQGEVLKRRGWVFRIKPRVVLKCFPILGIERPGWEKRKSHPGLSNKSHV